MACKHNPKGPACDKIGSTSKKLEFFCTKISAVEVDFELMRPELKI